MRLITRGPLTLSFLLVHKAIRANPEHVSKNKKTAHQKWSRQRMNNSQRKDRVRQKMVAFKKRALAAQQAADE